MTIEVGQIWREVDPRFERFVRVESVAGGSRRSVGVRTVVRFTEHSGWGYAPRSRLSYCDANRFNGKRGGYEPVADQASPDIGDEKRG